MYPCNTGNTPKEADSNFVAVGFYFQNLFEIFFDHPRRKSKVRNAKLTNCKLVFNCRSQFFQRRWHFSSQAKERSTTHR